MEKPPKRSRQEIRDQKAALLQRLRVLREQVGRLYKVPARVVNGSHQDAVAWKVALQALQANHFAHTAPRQRMSLRELQEVTDALAAQYEAVSH